MGLEMSTVRMQTHISGTNRYLTAANGLLPGTSISRTYSLVGSVPPTQVTNSSLIFSTRRSGSDVLRCSGRLTFLGGGRCGCCVGGAATTSSLSVVGGRWFFSPLSLKLLLILEVRDLMKDSFLSGGGEESTVATGWLLRRLLLCRWPSGVSEPRTSYDPESLWTALACIGEEEPLEWRVGAPAVVVVVVASNLSSPLVLEDLFMGNSGSGGKRPSPPSSFSRARVCLRTSSMTIFTSSSS